MSRISRRAETGALAEGCLRSASVRATRTPTRGMTRVREATMDRDNRGLWDIEEVAAYLKVPVNSIYKMTARKARTPIPHVRLSGRLRFRKADIDRWLELLTISNLEVLERLHRHTKGTRHGDDSQTPAT